VVRLVAVPSFLTSGLLVLVDLDSLEARPVTFTSLYQAGAGTGQ
jgi:hypothetical protein